MQQQPPIPTQPCSCKHIYPLRLPNPPEPSRQGSGNRQVGLIKADGAHVPLQPASFQPLLTRSLRPKMTASRETINISICSTSTSDIQTLQDSATSVNDTSLASSVVTEPSIALTAYFPPSPFPPRSFETYRPKRLVFKDQLQFSQYPPSLFSNKTWKAMWLQRQEVDLDCLSFTNTLQPSNSQNLGSSPFQYETEFTGYAYRVVVDPDKCHTGIHIQCGSIINIANLNTEEGKYVVDACQLVHDKFSFFPIHYWIGDGQGFTSADDYHHYSFILTVPSTYIKVTKSPLFRLLLKLKPARSFLPIALLNFFFRTFAIPSHHQHINKTRRRRRGYHSI